METKGKTNIRSTLLPRAGLWTGLPTPWTDQEELDVEAFRRTLVRCADGISGIYVGGTTGEFHSMDDSQFANVVKTFAETMEEITNVGVQVGCGASSLHQVCHRIRVATDHGFSTIQLPLPGWMTLTDDEVLSFYSDVTDQFPNVQIIVYDNPSSGRNIGPDLWPRLLASVPSVRGAKMGKLDKSTYEIIRAARSDFFFLGVESNFLKVWPLGVRSMAAWITYSMPSLIIPLWHSLEKNDVEAIRKASEKVEKLAIIKDSVRSFGYRGGIIDRLMGLATGFLEPAFHRVLKPWRSIDPTHVAFVRKRIGEEIGSEYLY
jgi:4-hydroxy-tetrahydrodipicolinate synthase